MKDILSEAISFIADTNGTWGKGRIQGTYNIPYNLQWLVKIVLVLLLIVALPFLLLFWLGTMLCKAIVWLWPFVVRGFRWLRNKIGDFIGGLGILLYVFWLWLTGFFKSKVKKETKKEEKKSKWWLWLLLLLLLLLLLGFGLFKSCSKDNVVTPDVPEVVYYDAFDHVVVARAYMDGVQTEVTNDRVLVGLKYVNGQSLEPLKGSDFNGFAYEQSLLQIADDWKPVVVESLAPDLQLTEQQMVVITLTAMRMGPKGFPRSTFCKKVNEGDYSGATSWLCLQKADGSRREMGEEATLYFYMLKMLWTEQISVEEMADLPMFSYKNLSVEDTKSPTLTASAKAKLLNGNFRTPREALNLR